MTGVGFVCPFCGQSVTAYIEDDEAHLLHVMPPCDAFRDMAPDDYLAASRKMLQADLTATAPGGRS